MGTVTVGWWRLQGGRSTGAASTAQTPLRALWVVVQAAAVSTGLASAAVVRKPTAHVSPVMAAMEMEAVGTREISRIRLPVGATTRKRQQRHSTVLQCCLRQVAAQGQEGMVGWVGWREPYRAWLVLCRVAGQHTMLLLQDGLLRTTRTTMALQVTTSMLSTALLLQAASPTLQQLLRQPPVALPQRLLLTLQLLRWVLRASRPTRLLRSLQHQVLLVLRQLLERARGVARPRNAAAALASTAPAATAPAAATAKARVPQEMHMTAA